MNVFVQCLIALVLVFGFTQPLRAENTSQPVSVPAVDAPELAWPGDYPVGTRQVDLVQPDQLDALSGEDPPGRGDRHLPVRVWYPATAAGAPITYRTALPGADGNDVPFDLHGMASADIAAAQGRFPLVLLAHGYSNTPEVLAWLGENLASKGYVVVAPAFGDPSITIRTPAAWAKPLARRPLDIAFVAAEVSRRAQSGETLFDIVDITRVALVGYSMGGYGVLTAAGAPLDPSMSVATRGILEPFVNGGHRAGELIVPNLKAVVAIAPPMAIGPLSLWAPAGIERVATPTLYSVGSRDTVVGYDPGVRTLFENQSHAQRYLLTFREAGHSIGLVSAPPSMRQSFWDIDWFEDGVWRKDRLLAIQTHFITAFLDRYVKGDEQRAAFLDGLGEDSNDGVWPDSPGGRHDGFSPGEPNASLWKGFQKGKASGMSLEMRQKDK